MDVTPLRNSVEEERIGSWSELPFFNNGSFDRICDHLANEQRPILPSAGNILRAFELTRREDVRVVIVGQDPYPNWNPRLAAGLATGLAFAVPDCTVTLPPSLEHIFDKIPNHRTGPNLEYWAAQGVLLLNTILTIPVDTVNGSQKGVNEGERSHRDFGWESLIGDALADLTHSNDVFFMFFGVSARDKKIIPQNLLNQLSQVNQAASQVIGVSHPSDRGRPPDTPWVPFSTSSPFTQANNIFPRSKSATSAHHLVVSTGMVAYRLASWSDFRLTRSLLPFRADACRAVSRIHVSPAASPRRSA